MSGVSVCVVQPRLLPPVFYLRRMVDADVTVLLTSAQYTRKSRGVSGVAGFTGQSHFRLVGGWVGVPLLGARRVPLDQVGLDRRAQACAKLKRALEPVDGPFEWFMGHFYRAGSLGALGTSHLDDMIAQLGLDVVTVTDRELGVTSEDWSGQEWMLEIARRVGADRYLAGMSAVVHYLDPVVFEEAGVRVDVQRWNEQTPPSVGVPGVSCLEWMRAAPNELRAALT